jgi:hypothetical protein
MMGDIAKAEYLASDAGGQDRVVWTYTAPDYYTETEKALLPLLQQQTSENKE